MKFPTLYLDTSVFSPYYDDRVTDRQAETDLHRQKEDRCLHKGTERGCLEGFAHAPSNSEAGQQHDGQTGEPFTLWTGQSR